MIERTFDSAKVEKMFGADVRHTIEPEVTYRYVTWIDNFLNVLRFDDIDIAGDTIRRWSTERRRGFFCGR